MLIHRLERLEALPRTGWIPCGVTSPESIASHSFVVATVALWLGDTLREEDPEAWPVDIAKLVRIALLHDVAESILTDLPLPVKHFLGSSHIDQAEARAADHILQDSPAPWPQAHRLYQARQCLESRIVKAADQIQMLAKASQYASQGRGDLSRFFAQLPTLPDYGIPLVRHTLDLLATWHAQGHWFDHDFD